MIKKDLKKLTKSQLINMLLKKDNIKQKIESAKIPITPPCKPTPAPRNRKSVKQMVQEYEDNIIPPPPEFRDKEHIIPPPLEFRDKPVPLPRTKKPVPLPRTKITLIDKALKGFTQSYNISIKNIKDPLLQLQNTRKALERNLSESLVLMKGLKFSETIKVTFEKIAANEITYKTVYFSSVTKTIIDDLEIPEALELSKQEILNRIAVWISEGSGWTIE